MKAISMCENDEGFLIPIVDQNACKDCGICQSVCPALSEKRNNITKPDCYAAQAPDEIRAVSSSGGVFTLLAEEILSRGGFVCGAAFREDWSVHHIIVDNKEDLAKLRGSKYVQSDTEECYKCIKILLKKDKWVLFSGTPCQVAGLYTYLAEEYEKLVTVDIFCHGGASPGVWQRYLKENYAAESIDTINFRDKKSVGWSSSHVTITLKNGQKFICNNYTKWFHKSVILRLSCKDCSYSKLPRPADISLGDWWGIEDIAPNLSDGKGLSNVLLNTPKGESFYKSIKHLTLSEVVRLPENYNNGNIRTGLNYSFHRPYFFRENMPLNTQMATEISMRQKYDVCYVSNFFGVNYGAMLVHYAGYKLIDLLGLSVLMLDRPHSPYPPGYEETEKVVQYAFARRHYPNISQQFNTLDDMANLNNYCDAYVVGSDQLFNPGLNLDSLAYLQFARKDKLKIAFGTSFGHNSYKCDYVRLFKALRQKSRVNDGEVSCLSLSRR